MYRIFMFEVSNLEDGINCRKEILLLFNRKNNLYNSLFNSFEVNIDKSINILNWKPKFSSLEKMLTSEIKWKIKIKK